MRGLGRRRFVIGAGAVLAVPAGGPAAAAPRRRRIEIRAFAFDPPVLTVAAGDGVEWVNRDLVPHTATAVDGRWDTGPIGRDGSRSLLFEAPGRHRYVCAFHPHMTGTIVVGP